MPGRSWPKQGAGQPASEVLEGRKPSMHAACSLEEGTRIAGGSAFLRAAPAVRPPRQSRCFGGTSRTDHFKARCIQRPGIGVAGVRVTIWQVRSERSAAQCAKAPVGSSSGRRSRAARRTQSPRAPGTERAAPQTAGAAGHCLADVLVLIGLVQHRSSSLFAEWAVPPAQAGGGGIASAPTYRSTRLGVQITTAETGRRPCGRPSHHV